MSRAALGAVATGLTLLVAVAVWAGPQTSKANPALIALRDQYVAHQASLSGEAFAPRDAQLRVVGGRGVVDAAADGDADALAKELTALGMRNVTVFGRVVSGELPIQAVADLDRVSTLRFARPSRAFRRVGAITSQGDPAMRADLGRAAFSVTGAGVTVGVLSDSFDCLGGAAANVAAGDLPAVTVIQEVLDCAEGSDEGRAMLQIVHDVAPGASLAFASAFNGEASFASNIVALRNSGARVIVDDIFYLDEPMFQDGVIAQAVDTVVAQGAAFFTAAGNDARRSYESVFRPGTTFGNGAFPSAPDAPPFFGGVAHNFAPSGPADHLQRITIPSGGSLTISVQWDSPFFSVSGPPGTPNDLDVYVFNAAGTRVVGGLAAGNAGGDAVESFTFTNEGATGDFNLMIVNFSGPNPGFIKYIHFGGDVTIAEHATASPTVFGHTAAAGAEAVGAAFYANTPAFGVSPPLKEPFTSAGPARILFDTAGNRLATPITRVQPRITAPDGVATSGISGLFSTFFGTSAAAPHAAGVAALMLERQPALSPTAIYAGLETTAVNMGPPDFDFDTGFGLIQADAALQVVGPHLTMALTLNRDTVAAGDPVQVAISITNPGPSLLQDLYFLLLVPPALSSSLGCPAGDAIVFIAGGFSSVVTRCASSEPLQTFPPLFTSMPIPAGTLDNPNLISFPWPPNLPAGTYTFAIVTTLLSAFSDGALGPADVTAVAADTLQKTP
jgi:hypothetical protein